MSMKSLNKNFQSSFTHNSKKMEIIQLPINKWMDKLRYSQTLEYYWGIQKWSTNAGNNMDKYQRKNPNTKKYSVWVHFFEILEKINLIHSTFDPWATNGLRGPTPCAVKNPYVGWS